MPRPSPGHDTKRPEPLARGALSTPYRLRDFGRSLAAACFLAGIVFFAEPLRGDAATLCTAFVRARFSAGAAALTVFRFEAVLAVFTGRPGFDGLSTLAGADGAAVTFSACFAGAVANFGFFKINFPVGTAGAAAGAAMAGGVEFVLPFGRPPFRAN